ncbi:MAG: TetR/AcrR family transcriptional regulator C-terminal domain-containing protein [Eubacteriales bacterium]|jgi:probable dihydroxyacetone kinase regulator
MADANITKKALADSMKKLMKKKPFDKISVIDICEGCGMNRKSFYYHFKDKYDLVNWIFYTDFIKTVSDRHFEKGWDLLTATVEMFSKDRDFYKSALEITGQNSFREYFFESTYPIFDLFLPKEDDMSEEERKADIKYLSAAFLTVLYWWLADGKDQSPEDFTNSMRKIVKILAGSGI